MKTAMKTDLKTRLLDQGHEYAFFQALRLLRYQVRNEQGADADEKALSRHIRVRPELSLNFPGTDLAGIAQSASAPGRYSVTATFLGLYGASSPLPAFYTEDLLEERRNDRSIIRDFLDVINTPIYDLLFGIWRKYQLAPQIEEERDPRTMDRLYCLLGLGSGAFRNRLENPYHLLRYIGLATQLPRSAEGLRTLLADLLETADIEVIPCVERMAPVPAHQRLYLNQSGNILGENSVLGERVPDRMGQFRIRIASADGELLHRLLPDGELFEQIREMIRFYLDQPLDWDMEIILKPGEADGIILGREPWASLGWNTWLLAGPVSDEVLSVQLEALT